MKDFLGREYGVGDTVIYAAGSGRSITMVVGKVVSIKERCDKNWGKQENGEYGYTEVPNGTYSVRVLPVRSSRWKQHSGHDYYVDARTEKRIDPWRGSVHVKEHGYYTDKTGRRLPEDCDQYYAPGRSGWSGYRNPNYVPVEQRIYHGTVFHDYVEKRNSGIKPVTLTVTENIVKWDGELPDDSE